MRPEDIERLDMLLYHAMEGGVSVDESEELRGLVAELKDEAAGRPAKPKKKRRSKDIGTDAERPVARWLASNGWPNAERRAMRGRDDAGDITGTPGICWSVKGGDMARNASDLDIERWLAALEKQRINAHADVGVLVLQRRGVGEANANRWWAVMDAAWVARLLIGDFQILNQPTPPVRMLLGDVVHLLRAAGFGEPLPDPEPLETPHA